MLAVLDYWKPFIELVSSGEALYVVSLYSERSDNINLWMSETWFSVHVKEPIAYAKVEVLEASELKPSDLNG